MRVSTKQLWSKIEAEAWKRIREEGASPVLGFYIVGNDPASMAYARSITRAANRVGANVALHAFDDDVPWLTVVDRIENSDEDSIMVQRPIRPDIETSIYIHPNKDVDAFGDRSHFRPPTAQALYEILKWHFLTLERKNILIIGRSKIVGRSLARMLEDEPCTLMIANSNTDAATLDALMSVADAVVVAVGKPGFISYERAKKLGGFIKLFIDVGYTVDEDGNAHGDVDPEVAKIFDCTTVPGGVGPVTTACLMRNVAKTCEW